MINPLVEQIKSRLPILEAAQRYTGAELQRRGNSFWCRCLTHDERTPSMQIMPDKDKYRCFSCQRHGDQIDLVAEALGLTNTEAIKRLAHDLNIETDDGLSRDERDLIELERLIREEEKQKKLEQEQAIDAEYDRLIDIEKLMYVILSSIKDESDLDRHEVIQSLRHKDMLDEWINTLFKGEIEDKLAVLEASKNWNPWKTNESGLEAIK